MIHSATFGGDTFQEAAYRVRDFAINNGITDVRDCHISPVVDPDTEKVLGFTAVIYYTTIEL